MTRRIHTMLALAASATIGTGVLMAADPQLEAPQNTHAAREAVPPKAPGAQATADQAANADRQAMMQRAAYGEDPKTAPDKLFILNTALDNMAEVAMSQTAQAQSTDPQIKQLASHMIEDHTALGQKLQQTAQEVGVALPQSVTTPQNQEGQIFASLSGKELDNAYLSHMNSGHAKTIACFEGAAALSQNPKVRQLASDTLPTLREHRRMVQQVAMSEGINFRQGDDNAALPAGAQLRGTNGINDASSADSTHGNPANGSTSVPNASTATPPGSAVTPAHTTDKNGR